MPFEITFDKIPAGYAESAVQGGGEVMVSLSGFYSSEDGDELITRLEGLPQQIISRIPSKFPILPSMVHYLLAIIRKDRSATVYLNEGNIVGQVRIKGGVQKGELISADRVLDMGKITFQDIQIPSDTGIVFVFSIGWRKGFFYDLAPLHGDEARPREYDIDETIGSLFSYLLFQERFKIDEKTWKKMFEQKWFPFAYLDNALTKDMIGHSREGWDIDSLLPKISNNVKRLLKNLSPIRKSIPYYSDHADIFEAAIQRYIEDDHISCASILYPRIEGLMRSFHREAGYKTKPSAKTLARVVIEHHENRRISHSLLLPDKFHQYLDNIYFAHFAPGSSPDVGRHSVAHGEARSDDFTLKSCTISLLILYQLSLFISDG